MVVLILSLPSIESSVSVLLCKELFLYGKSWTSFVFGALY